MVNATHYNIKTIRETLKLTQTDVAKLFAEKLFEKDKSVKRAPNQPQIAQFESGSFNFKNEKGIQYLDIIASIFYGKSGAEISSQDLSELDFGDLTKNEIENLPLEKQLEKLRTDAPLAQTNQVPIKVTHSTYDIFIIAPIHAIKMKVEQLDSIKMGANSILCQHDIDKSPFYTGLIQELYGFLEYEVLGKNVVLLHEKKWIDFSQLFKIIKQPFF